MARETKFRARRVDNHPAVWAYGYFVKTPITAEFNDCNGAFFDSGKSRYCIVTDTGVAHEVDVETLGEFTGLLDRYGKPIYEGDVLEKKGQIVPERREVRDIRFDFYPLWNEDREVNNIDWLIVGNVYSNPELLTEQKYGNG